MCIPNVRVGEVILCVKIVCFMCVWGVLVCVCLGKWAENNAASRMVQQKKFVIGHYNIS